jgi:Abi-like protein
LQTLFFDNLERVLSKDRFAAYKQNGESNTEALKSYLWNIAICESLYPSFQILEVGIRNAIHLEISKVSKEPVWLNNEPAFLYDEERESIKQAKESVRKRCGSCPEPRLIAEMSFGFWTSLLDSRYETMWHKIIAQVFPHMPRTIRTRGEVSKRMNSVRRLRNAAFHHHSIWHWKDLEQQHKEIHTLIGWICTSIEKMAKETNQSPNVYLNGSDGLSHLIDKISN